MTRLILVIALALAMPAAAFAAPPTGGHGGSTPQATSQYATTGPATAGLAYEVNLGVELTNEPREAIMASNGYVILQGRIATDLPETEQDESRQPRESLIAINPSTGQEVWRLLDIEYTCIPVATSDGRIIAQLDSQTPTNPEFDTNLVAIDADTGELLAGQEYDGEQQDDDRLSACQQRLILTPDESTVLVPGSFNFNRRIRAIDIDEWVQTWSVDLRDVEDFDSPPIGSRVVINDAGDGFYVAIRWNSDMSPAVWRLLKYDLSGNLVTSVDLPGVSSAFTDQATIAVDGGIALVLDDCQGGPSDTDECVVFYDDGPTLSQRWIAYEPDTGGNNFFATLARADSDTLVGWSEVDNGSDVSAIDVDTGAVKWSFPTGFSNNGSQLVTDAAGNAYFGTFGGLHLVSLTADGHLRFEIDGCHVGDVNEPDILAAIAPDGTLVTTHRDDDGTEVVRGFRTGEELPKGTCPEEQRRISGLGRVETAVDVSQRSFQADNSADTVVIATAFNYPDALAGGPLARSLDAPLLLTQPDSLSRATKDEIERLGASSAIVLGGTAAVSTTAEDDLKAMGLAVERIAGESRFDTATLVADRVPATTVYITEGANADPNRGWPDAVAVSALASFEQRPILLVTRDVLPSETTQQMIDMGVTNAVIIGGTASVSDPVASALADPDGDGTDDVTVTRVSGASRFATSVEVAKRSVAAGASTLDLWFATGLSFPDALAAGPAVARTGGVLLLVHGQDPNGGPAVYDWLNSLDRDRTLRGTLVGGTNAITQDVAAALADAAGIQ